MFRFTLYKRCHTNAVLTTDSDNVRNSIKRENSTKLIICWDKLLFAKSICSRFDVAKEREMLGNLKVIYGNNWKLVPEKPVRFPVVEVPVRILCQ